MTMIMLLFSSGYMIGQVSYPYPVKYINLSIEQKNVRMAYMDVPSSNPMGEVFMLFHGKNFSGFYWKEVISFLNETGFRVIVPDQVGWGKSDKPDLHYSFHMLALNNRVLLDSLNVRKVNIIGHSMGGMLAARFALMYPEKVNRLILENPIGLEDYRTFVPYVSLETQYQAELSSTYESYKKYQQTYYPVWKPEYEELVKAQAEALSSPDFKEIAWVNALTYQMIYEQPVCYEFRNIKPETLLIIGLEDRTIVGKNRMPEDLINRHGQYPQLGKQVHSEIDNSRLTELKGIGHIPHIQDIQAFRKIILEFMKKG